MNSGKQFLERASYRPVDRKASERTTQDRGGMTDLERFLACMSYQSVDRVPFHYWGPWEETEERWKAEGYDPDKFDLRMGGVTCGEGRTNVEKTVRYTLEAVARFGYDWAVVFPDDYIEFEPLGLSMRQDDALPAMPLAYLPMDRRTLAGFRIPDARNEMRLPIHLEMIRKLKGELGDTVCVMGRIAAPFSALSLVYGVEALLVNMLESPEVVRDNFKFFVDHQIAFGKAQLEAGADLLWLGDCVASSNFVRVEHFSGFAFEPAATVAEALSKAGGHVIYHAAEASLPHLKMETELPVAAVNVGEGVCIADVKRELGSGKCLMGNFDPLILRDGTPGEVVRATEEMIRENLRGGGYIFNTGEGVMANTPPENVDAMMSTAPAADTRLGDPIHRPIIPGFAWRIGRGLPAASADSAAPRSSQFRKRSSGRFAMALVITCDSASGNDGTSPLGSGTGAVRCLYSTAPASSALKGRSPVTM